jgi:hypothetical protein
MVSLQDSLKIAAHRVPDRVSPPSPGGVGENGNQGFAMGDVHVLTVSKNGTTARALIQWFDLCCLDQAAGRE